MPYKDRQKQREFMREYRTPYMHSYRLRLVLKARRQKTLDRLGRFLMEVYLKKLMGKVELLQKIKASHPNYPSMKTAFDSLILRLIDMMHEGSVNVNPHSYAYFFANGIAWLTSVVDAHDGKIVQDLFSDVSHVDQRLVRWIWCFEEVIAKPTKENEENEQEAWNQLDETWKKLLTENVKIDREPTGFDKCLDVLEIPLEKLRAEKRRK